MAESHQRQKQKTVVIGAGPVGALAALYAAGRGDEVEVYELRGDLRDPNTTPLNFTKSINLALSERGISAMRHTKCSGLIDAVFEETIPMHGRMIHGRDKKGDLFEDSQEYDVMGRFLRAVDRAGLNKRLLDELEAMPNVKLFFNHRLTGADFKKNTAWFQQTDAAPNTDDPAIPTQSDFSKGVEKRFIETSASFDLMIGADGAHSAARQHMMKYARVNYQQEYIDTLWCEFHIPPLPEEQAGGFRISPHHLHIWPGGEFMFIAIPSLDHSFTCTLFLPESRFSELSDKTTDLLGFFNENFPGVAPDLITPDDLVKQFTENPHLPLISIKCTPYHYASSVVILGDAAHAMVPFYGQGMNAGLEDVRVLFEFLDKHSTAGEETQGPQSRKRARAAALAEYSKQRTPDASAINDLALQNYTEMRSSVRSPLYRLRKYIEESVNKWLPSVGWQTQYSRISFGNERYSEVEKAVERQGRVLLGVLGLGLTVGLGMGGVGYWRWRHATDSGRFLTRWLTWAAKRSEEIGRGGYFQL
ncbi:MAG: kynurenine 3-monooxygenase, mitochondrial precursor [Pycnora praestabilis]|nr:MAG: kynurenine 3-monooxygenase, mitochondrial precursor [Pycnora praestabilis]